MTTRKAELKDFSEIKRLMLQALYEDPTAFSVSAEEYAPNSEYWWMGYINPFLIGNSQEMILTFEKEKLIGMVGITYDFKERKKHIASIVWFYVDKAFRGKGFGKTLLEKVLNTIDSKKHITKVALLVVASQLKAISMYEKLGFEKNGTLKQELRIDGKYYDVLLMEKLFI